MRVCWICQRTTGAVWIFPDSAVIAGRCAFITWWHHIGKTSWCKQPAWGQRKINVQTKDDGEHTHHYFYSLFFISFFFKWLFLLAQSTWQMLTVPLSQGLTRGLRAQAPWQSYRKVISYDGEINTNMVF